MAAINFPDSPTAGDTFTSNDKTWVYLDGKWTFQTSEVPLSVSITSATSGQFLKWNGSAWVNDAIDLSTDTTGSFVASLVAGTGVTLANNSGEASTPTVTVDTTVIAPLASPTFTGTPTLPTGTIATTQTASDSTTKIATTAFVTTADNLKANLASPTFTGTVTASDITVSGNLTVSGTTTSINTETLTVNDNIVVLNNNVTSAPTENAGIEVERGSSTNVVLRWNETSDKWELTNDGSTYADIATESYAASLTPATLNDIGDVTITSPAAGQTIQWNGSAWINITPTGTTVTTTANRSTDIPSPFIGQLIVLTDTKKVQLWDGTAWLNITMAPPEPPTSLSAIESPTSVAISFTTGVANGSAITNYKYALSTDGGSTYGSFTALNPADFTTPITVSGLSMNTAYYVKLKAVNDLGDSVASSAVSFTTEGVPAAPTSLSASNETGDSVTIAFTAGAANGASISNYKYAVSTDNVTYSAFAALSPADFTTPVTVSGLASGTLQYVKLKAVNTNGDSAASAAVSFTTLSTPSAPTSLSAGSIEYNSVAISFTPGSQGGSAISNYQYAISTNSGSTYGSFTALATPDATSPITISGLTASTAYYIKLKAVNSSGAGAESSAVSFSTTAIPPLAADYLVIAGAGGGAGWVGGGGGAGGYREFSAVSLTASTNYLVTIGAGGTGGPHAVNNAPGGNGSDSVFSTTTSTAGAGGGGYDGLYAVSAPSTGGSGGGAGGGNSNAANGSAGNTPSTSPSQGNNGGNTLSGHVFAGAGGGGAGGVGGNVASGSQQGGSGGAGSTSSITGSAVVRASGGQGGVNGGSASATTGGGGAGGVSGGVAATAGTANTGGGGGGERDRPGAAGGSGVVILRYVSAYTITIGAGLTGSTATDGSYKVTTLTAGTGNVSWA